MNTPEYLFDHREDINLKISQNKRTLILSDYDGTLTPIAETPARAIISDEGLATIDKVLDIKRYRLGIISGRTLTNMKQLLGERDSIFYSGNHGLEIEGPGVSWKHPTSLRKQEIIHKIARRVGDKIEAEGLARKGAIVEDKIFTVAVHWRAVKNAGDVDKIKSIFRTITAEAVESGDVIITKGRKVLEARPNVDWNKGKAVREIYTRVTETVPGKGVLLIYFGDDKTDEDAFKIVNTLGGISIRVREQPKPTNATYYVRSPEEVMEFLEQLPAFLLPIDQKLKICYVSQSFLPHRGGLADYVWDIGKRLHYMGAEVHEVTFLKAVKGKPESEREHSNMGGVHVHRFDPGSDSSLKKYTDFKEIVTRVTHNQTVGAPHADENEPGLKDLVDVNKKALKMITEMHAEHNFDVIHVHDFQMMALGKLIREEFPKKGLTIPPLIFTMHFPIPGKIPGQWAKFLASYFDQFDRIIVSTDEYLKALTEKGGVDKDKVRIIHPAVDINRYHLSHKGHVFAEKYNITGKDIILCVSRIDPRKGQEYLIWAMADVLKKHTNAVCVIVGNGSATAAMMSSKGMDQNGRGDVRRRWLENEATKLGIRDKIIFTGEVSDEELNWALDAAKITVQPSIMEAWGLTVTESMAHYNMVVGSDVGGIRGQIVENRKYGMLFMMDPSKPEATARDLGKKLNELLDNKELRDKIRGRLKKRLKELDMPICLGAHIKLYMKILGGKY